MESILKEMLEDTTAALGLGDPAIVEKDLYVTHVLQAVSDISNDRFQLVFIGGTCLTKAHRVVGRMSEDIDFKLVPLFDRSLNAGVSRREISAFRQEILKVIQEKTGFYPKDGQIRKGNNNTFTQIFLDYPTIYPHNTALRQQIKIEITAQKLKTPIEYLPVNSLVYDIMGEKSGMPVKTIPCISLDETVSEKWAALNRRVAEVERRGFHPDNAIVRHLFDMHEIHIKRGIGSIFEELVPDVVLRDRARYKGKSPQFFENTIKELASGAEALHQNPIWEDRYLTFTENMVFEGKNHSFQEALKSLDQLNQRAFAAIEKNQACEIIRANSEKNSKDSSISTQTKYELERAKSVVRLSDAAYHGKFVHVDSEYVYQETGKDKLVKHKILSFQKNQLPEVGKVGSVRYKNGEAKVLLVSSKKNLKLSL